MIIYFIQYLIDSSTVQYTAKETSMWSTYKFKSSLTKEYDHILDSFPVVLVKK